MTYRVEDEYLWHKTNSDHAYMKMHCVGRFKTPRGEDIVLAIEVDENPEIPHLHFYRGIDIPEDCAGGGCLKLKENSFYKNNGHDDIFNQEELNALIRFLQGNPYGDDAPNVRWKRILHLWNLNNDEQKISKQRKIPYNASEIKYQ